MRLGFLGLLLAVTCAAQDVPPPPRPADAPAGIESQLKLIQDRVAATGRVTWSQTTRHTATGEITGPTPEWEEVSNLQINPQACEMKLAWNKSTPWGTRGVTVWFETLDDIEVKPNYTDTTFTFPEMPASMTPTIYSVVANNRWDLKFPDQTTAMQVAAAMRQAAQMCKVIPTVPNDGPSLEETLGFIQTKLAGQGAVSYTVSFPGAGGSPHTIYRQFSDVTGDAKSCRLSFRLSDMRTTLNLRRIEKLSVMSLDEASRVAQTGGYVGKGTQWTSSGVYDLVVTNANGWNEFLPIADQDLANRVAKAMLHASELCGAGGANKEPF